MAPNRTDASKRLVNVLMREHQEGRLHYFGRTGEGRYRIQTNAGRERAFDADGMWAWLRARDLGQAAGPATPPPADVTAELAGIRRVLVNPTLGDQCRTQIRAAMAHVGMGITNLADTTGRTRHAVRVALRWGATEKLSMKMAEQMMAGTGCGWRVQFVPVEQAGAPGDGELATLAPTAVGVPVAPPEPPGVTRMRAAAIAHEAGIARLVSPLEPNAAYRAGSYVLAVPDAGDAATGRRIQAEVVVPWVTGLADGRDSPAADALTLP